MIVEPSITELLELVEDRYELIILASKRLNTFEELLDIAGCHVQVQDALDDESHTEDKAEEHGGHPAGTTLDVLFFEHLVERLGVLLGGGSSFLNGGGFLDDGLVGGLGDLFCGFGSGLILCLHVIEVGKCQQSDY